MNDNDAIIRLLTDIRDDQREEIVMRRKQVEEAIRLQRVGLRWQRIGLTVIFIVAAIVTFYYRNHLFGW